MTSGLNLKRVAKRYPGGIIAAREVSLELESGQIMVLLGPSGCGKTTTVRLIAGLESLDSGAILLNNQPIHQLRPAQRDVAMVFQDGSLYPHLNVARNLGFALQMARIPTIEIEQRIQSVAAMMGISELLQRSPGSLSGGQIQRVALARALVRRPAVLLMDEPLSNLDAPVRATLRRELKLLQRQHQLTILYVTHDQHEAFALADQMAIMAGGSIQQVGKPPEIYRSPANRVVAQFIGEPAMNLLPATLTTEGRPPAIYLDSDPQLQIQLPDLRAPIAPDRPVHLGLRPAQIQLVSHGQSLRPDQLTLPVQVQTTEQGFEWVDVCVRTAGGTQLNIRVAATEHTQLQNCSAGQDCAAVFSEHDVHLFARGGADDGLAIRFLQG